MRLVLLGSPVAHSASPSLHAAALAACGISGEYTARDAGRRELAAAIDELVAGIIDGANVTMPLKRVARLACEWVDPEAAAAGAVNTLAYRDGMVAGWNTDVPALREALSGMAGPVLVLGGGGAAAAAVIAARDLGEVMVADRRGVAAEALGVGSWPWGRALPGAVVVNATPLGMRGESLPEGVVEEAAGLVDLAYAAAATPAMLAATRAGTPAVDGRTVLIAQAAASFEIWTGCAAPREAMALALKGAAHPADRPA